MSEPHRHLSGFAWLIPLAAIVLPVVVYYGSFDYKTGPQLREVSYATDADRGAALYAENCAKCHGPKGKGDGPMAKMLTNPPPDLITGDWKHSKDIDGLKKVIREGLPTDGMPATAGLSKSDFEHLAAYAWRLRPQDKEKAK